MSLNTVSMSLGCDYNSRAIEMTCTVDQKGGNDDTDGPVTAVLSGSEVAFLSATIVEGASLLSGGAKSTEASKSAAVASTGLRSSASTTASGSATARAQASGAGASPTSSGATVASTGAAARYGVEGSALLALVGAAALNMW
ncbi:hypothetical protein BKA66DRAFT_470552 [Pyrenochaeta sp. MPI-SDFR-AT-0127]|nr:hypothetical protein BKA66DRAFT_470552 [Pyrenochaeta sp. MPI-SDFR-AT-0127]